MRDHGIGIPVGEQKKIFDKFYRGSGEAQLRCGFGLGLSIARAIVEAHGGTIQAMAADGGGAVVAVELPAL